jgi:ribosomal protein L30/L7E
MDLPVSAGCSIMSIEASSPPTFCGICGWPTGGQTCPACGAEPTARADGCDAPNLRALAGPDAEDYPELKPAFLAWQQNDGPRYIRQCLQMLGVERPGSLRGADHDWWVFIQDSAVVFIGLDRQCREIAIESPILQLPQQRRVPLMRTLLHLNGSKLRDTRFCLRGDTVVLVYSDAFANLPPPRFLEAIREHALTADRFDDPLSLAFSARMLGPEVQQTDNPLQLLGTPLKLQTLKGKSQPLPAPGAPATMPGAESAAHRGVAERHSQISMSRLMAFKGINQLIKQSEEVLRLLRLHRATQRNEQMMRRLLGAELYVSRALVYLVQERFGAEVPGLVEPLARAAAPYLYTPPPLGTDQRLRHEPLLKACQEITTQQQPNLGARPPIKLRAFATANEAREHFSRLVTVIDSFEQPNVKHFLLTGMIAEMMLRVRLGDANVQRFREVLKVSDGQGGNPRIVHLLRQEIGKVLP